MRKFRFSGTLIVAFLKEVVQEPFSLISMHRVCLRLSRKPCLQFMDMLTKRSCMSLFVLFHQLQKILWSRPWRVALRMSEPSWYVTSCCLTLRGRNCLSLVLESSYLRSALALFEQGTVTLNRRIVLGTSVLGLIIIYL